jgi:hypothetical protein
MAHTQHWLTVSSRVAAAILGGYLFAWGFTALVIALNLAVGGDYHEGEMLAYLLAFLVYLCALLWAFAAASLARVWVILAGGGLALTGVAWAVAQTLGAAH